MFEATIREGVLCVRRPGTRWLSTGWNGGFSEGPAAYNVSVPEGWPEVDLAVYTRERRREAGFGDPGPTLLTGVALEHARCARLDSVAVFATAGLSNPAPLPMNPTGGDGKDGSSAPGEGSPRSEDDSPPGPGTVNLIVGTDRALDDAALANLVAVAAEAKAATLLAETGFPGTTTDAVVVGCDPGGEPAAFSGSATAVGEAARVCVRDAVRASLQSRYPDQSFPESVEAAEHGSRVDREATVSPVRGDESEP
jgi:adenosylcobinamide hydrolase